MKMNRLLQFLCCLSVYLLVLDSCAEARRSLFITEKDSTTFHEKKSQHLEVLKVESAAVFEAFHPKKNVEMKSISTKSNGGGVGVDPKHNKIIRNLMEEELAFMLGREMIEHIDYAGATTHPPSEPPKKKKTNAKQKSLHPPSRAH